MRIVAFGSHAWLVYTDRPLALAAAIPGSVPGEDCVLVRDRDALEHLAELPDPPMPEPITLTAEWTGEDLPEVTRRTGVDVVAALTGTTFTVAFCGFSPGFAYMRGLPPALHLPRRERPRPRVPAGSIAIAAGYIAVYPTESPGGWHLLGHCSTPLFDPEWVEPALLRPGTRVRFA
jgi:allophanate hydrolase subunit 1